jgi:hypothetical protein
MLSDLAFVVIHGAIGALMLLEFAKFLSTFMGV